MSCLSQRLSNIDTTIYPSQPSALADGFVPAQFQQPTVINPPLQVPSCPAPVRDNYPTQAYALFTNAFAPGETYAAGTNIPFPTTVYNTDERNIERNNGSVILSGGKRGKTYLVMYQVSATFTDAQLAVTENGVAQQPSAVSVTGDTTASGNYIVKVPACQDTSVSVNVLSGTVETATPTAGTNMTIVRLS